MIGVKSGAIWIPMSRRSNFCLYLACWPDRCLGYSLRPSIRGPGHSLNARRCGFTLRLLLEALKKAGFRSFIGHRRERQFELWVIASKTMQAELKQCELAARHFPNH